MFGSTSALSQLSLCVMVALVLWSFGASAQQRRHFRDAYDNMIGQRHETPITGRSYYTDQQSNMAGRSNTDAGVNPRGNVRVNPLGFGGVNPFGSSTEPNTTE